MSDDDGIPVCPLCELPIVEDDSHKWWRRLESAVVALVNAALIVYGFGFLTAELVAILRRGGLW